MPCVFMVCEKPSIAESIAKALSRGGSYQTRKSRNLTVHEFDGEFLHRNAHFKVTGLFGHIFSTDFEPHYNSWTAVKPEDLFYAPILKVEEKGSSVSGALAYEAHNVDYIILCLDCDREGENICFEVLDIIGDKINKKPNEQQIYRAKFSAVTR